MSQNGGVVRNVEAELACLLRGADFGVARGRKQLEILDEAANGNPEHRHGENNPGAAPPAHPEGEEPVWSGLLASHHAFTNTLLTCVGYSSFSIEIVSRTVRSYQPPKFSYFYN
ncbi:hypothetical protein SASPL_151860 [Salvia splendens]|uniref:Uncharacterized protein n=1 Tax=Salvia splendens TaxID=180675 RepID=A0A8X8W2C1_SALSN|nr:hypothetical protein SASPL_151860 [Salvia splendens]